jgi:L-2-hydroxyglutarate oxidase LhgO
MPAMEEITAVVIGAGVVGLACARALARRGIETVILERHAAFGSETSARNSEVIHAGLYYPSGSRKAALCVAGRHALYDFCAAHGVNHRRCGKLVVATDAAQLPKLQALQQQGLANGVDDLHLIDAAEARALEPALACAAALHSPATGIVDSHGLMLALLGDAERHGAALAVGSPFVGGRVAEKGKRGGGLVVEVADGSDGGRGSTQLAARLVINAAGLSAPRVAARLAGFPSEHCPPAHFAKGNYYALAGQAPFSRLIYPLPEPGGLGVHLTLDLAGQARFGPDVEWLPGDWLDAPDYGVDPRRADGFYAEVRRYWPQLADGALAPAYCGVRPKISGAGEPAADFLIQGPQAHGIDGLVNLFGIESPGLTASLAVADAACAMLTA